MREVKQRLSALEDERNELRIDIRKLSEQNSRYRSVNHMGVSDDTVRKRFVELRDIAQQIIHRYYTTQGPMQLSRHNNPHLEAQEDFRENLTSFRGELLQRLYLQAKLSDLLDASLLSARNFEVGEYEGALGRFERALDGSKNGR